MSDEITIIPYYRGDNEPIGITFTNETTKQPIDFSGCTIVFTLNSEESPENTDNELFKIIGIIVDVDSGKVEFPPTPTDFDLPIATYYFDIQRTNAAGKKKTIGEGEVDLKQDKNKD